MVKKAKTFDYLIASKLAEIRVVDTIEADYSDKNKDVILKTESNPETITILKDSFENLSEDTKMVIKFIFDIPDQGLNSLFADKQQKISIFKTRQLLKNSWGPIKSKKIFREIKKWLNELRY